MVDTQVNKAPRASKSFLAVGPTLHYSHQNVVMCWLLALVVFLSACVLWSKIVSGTFWDFEMESLMNPKSWSLAGAVTNGAGIFEYPWQILVLGLLIGLLGFVPALVSQLMSFRYSLPFVLGLVFLGNLPLFAVCVLISCIGAASRLFRFRSRIIAIALCTVPQLVYLGFFGGVHNIGLIKLGFSYAPWICALVTGLAIAGVVLGIGHFTRYKPGLIWIVSAVVLGCAFFTFCFKVGFTELDYQLYTAEYNPREVTEFSTHSLTDALDKTILDPDVRKDLVGAYFLPTDPILLRAELKDLIKAQLRYDKWPNWFMVPEELRYQRKREELIDKYNTFISKHGKSERAGIALYYKGILSEYSPDLNLIERERLCFYSDYAFEHSREIWSELYRRFDDSAESVEARWRMAIHWAGRGLFEEADKLLKEAESMAAEFLGEFEEGGNGQDSFLSPFQPPADTAMTKYRLTDAERRIKELRLLISEQNRSGNKKSSQRLAEFVRLNPYGLYYLHRIERLLEDINEKDALFDNLALARVNLIKDERMRQKRLEQLHKKFADRDGGIIALYELGRLKVQMWTQLDKSSEQQREKLLADTRTTLKSFMELYAESYYAGQVGENLSNLPKLD